ncbi:phosphatidylserine decarboxylase [bacterium]|nr:phosphatidylserine decarboxylase [bacterium]
MKFFRLLVLSCTILFPFSSSQAIRGFKKKHSDKKVVGTHGIKFYNLNNKRVEDNVSAFKTMKFFYTPKFFGATNFLFPKKTLSAVHGTWNRSWLSRHRVAKFIRKNNLDMSEYEEKNYKSFDDFFTRRLKPGMRKVDSKANVFSSPADGKCYVLTDLKKHTMFNIKGCCCSVLKLVGGDEDLAKKFKGGSLAVIRLAPYDYHRFHFPCDAAYKNNTYVDGKLDSVNPVAYSRNKNPLLTNKRVLLKLDTKEFGEVLMIPVGAACVGKIIVDAKLEGNYNKADEFGYFSCGGSTVALLFERGAIKFKKKLRKHSEEGYETEVKMGQRIGKKPKAKKR